MKRAYDVILTSYGTADMLVMFFWVMFIHVDNTFIRPKVYHKKVFEHFKSGEEASLEGFPGSDSRGFFLRYFRP